MFLLISIEEKTICLKKLFSLGHNIPIFIEIIVVDNYQQLKNNYDAIAICTGAEIPRDLNIENRNLKGIHFAMEFLSQQNDRVAGKIIEPSKGILRAIQELFLVDIV